MFLRDIFEGNLSFKGADEEQSKLVNELKDEGKGKIPIEKRSFLNNVILFLGGREKILNNFKNKIFQINNLGKISTPAPTSKPT